MQGERSQGAHAYLYMIRASGPLTYEPRYGVFPHIPVGIILGKEHFFSL